MSATLLMKTLAKQQRGDSLNSIIKGKHATGATMAVTLLTSLKPISCVAVTSKQKQIDGVLRSNGQGLQVGFECLQIMVISGFVNEQQMDGVYRHCQDSSV